MSYIRAIGTPIWLLVSFLAAYKPLSLAIAYLILGLTDVDGTIARILKIKSEFGEKLDSVSDFIYVVCGGAYILLNKLISPTLIWTIIILGVLTQATKALNYKKTGKFKMPRNFTGCFSILFFYGFVVITIMGIKNHTYTVITFVLMFHNIIFTWAQIFKHKFSGFLW